MMIQSFGKVSRGRVDNNTFISKILMLVLGSTKKKVFISTSLVSIQKYTNYIYNEDKIESFVGSGLHQVIKGNNDLTLEHHQFFLYQLLRGLKSIHSGHTVLSFDDMSIC